MTYSKNIPAQFHPDPISNDGALGFLGEVEPNKNNNKKKNNNKMSGDFRSVPDLKTGK